LRTRENAWEKPAGVAPFTHWCAMTEEEDAARAADLLDRQARAVEESRVKYEQLYGVASAQ
jgi:hypothetical protein